MSYRPQDDTLRVCLWSGPRNISTALMYSFAQRADTTVVDEPLYAHYLTSTDASDYHPGGDEVIAAQETDGEKVVREVIFGTYDTPVVFFKNMTHHLVDLDLSFLRHTVNIILTRHPREMLPSYAEQVDEPSLRDTGYPQHLQLRDRLRDMGQEPPVLDSRKVLEDPRGQLGELCRQIGIPFDEAMLSWQAGPRPEDGIWAEHWYDSVHRSTGFKPYSPKTDPFPKHLEELLEQCLSLYEELLKGRKQ